MQNPLLLIFDRLIALIPGVKNREQVYALGVIAIATLLGFWLYLQSQSLHLSISPTDEDTLARLQKSLSADRIVVWEYSGFGGTLTPVWDSYSEKVRSKYAPIKFSELRRVAKALEDGDCASIVIGDTPEKPPVQGSLSDREYIGYCPINSDRVDAPVGAISASTRSIPGEDYEGDWLTVLWQAGRSILRN